MTNDQLISWIERRLMTKGKLRQNAVSIVESSTDPEAEAIRNRLTKWKLRDKIVIIRENAGSEFCECGEIIAKSLRNRLFRCPRCSASERSTKSNASKNQAEISRKRRETMIKRYGVASALQLSGPQTEEQRETAKVSRRNTMLERYGVEHLFQAEGFDNKSGPSNPEVVKTRMNTMLDRYGRTTNFNSDDNQKRKIDQHASRLEPEILEWYGDPEKLYELHVSQQLTLLDMSERTGLGPGAIQGVFKRAGLKVHRWQTSSEERSFFETLELPGDVSFRDTRYGFEVDAFIPSMKLGIEYHGIYWHSSSDPKVNEKHRSKAQKAQEAGFKLFQFWSTEVQEKPEIVSSMIRNHVGASKRIHGRKTVLRELSPSEHRIFCEANHLQGSTGAKVRLGLFHQTELVAAMSFGESRFSGKTQWEMIRFCVKTGLSVSGGASKLWKHFVENWKPETVVTYADARISDGNLYRTLGFEYSHHSAPNYGYLVSGKIRNRVGFQKHKLVSFLGEKFDPSKTEKQNMTEAGYRIIYDAGNLVFTWSNETIKK